MEVYINPPKSRWDYLCKRPVLDTSSLNKTVYDIMNAVKSEGDAQLLAYAEKFDKIKLSSIVATADEIDRQADQVAQSLKEAIQVAAANIEKFHKAQRLRPEKVTTSPGVVCWRKQLPIQKVGLYVPGGTAPLFSSLLMLAIPAKLAGCETIVICTPPNEEGGIAPEIAYCCKLLGLDAIFKVGGAQAIAAMSFGTASIPKVDKIFGPGNQFVTRAKEMSLNYGLAIDMPAGPSEVLVIADKQSNPEFVAADLLSQAEHGIDSQVILLGDDLTKIGEIMVLVNKEVEKLPRAAMAKEALKNSKAVVFDELQTCMDFSNTYAPEHLILALENPESWAEAVKVAGSVFLGNYTPESAGDYASGTNHTLPTNGFARQYSGVSLNSFVNYVTFQQIDKDGIQNLGPVIERMAEAEGLQAHKDAVSVRLKAIADGY